MLHQLLSRNDTGRAYFEKFLLLCFNGLHYDGKMTFNNSWANYARFHEEWEKIRRFLLTLTSFGQWQTIFQRIDLQTSRYALELQLRMKVLTVTILIIFPQLTPRYDLSVVKANGDIHSWYARPLLSLMICIYIHLSPFSNCFHTVLNLLFKIVSLFHVCNLFNQLQTGIALMTC